MYMPSSDLYPLMFTSHLAPRIWGGEKLGIPQNDTPIGEQWLFSPLPEHPTPIANGPHAGKLLQELIALYPKEILGPKLIEDEIDNIPLLIKLIDAKEPLSIQVHPSDKTARQLNAPLGKSEMWYVLEAEPNASLTLGVKRETTPKELQHAVENHTVESLLLQRKTAPHHYHHIPGGEIHSIGAGLLLLEIQQPSDTTYRLYDWGRRDADGNHRALHITEALTAAQLTPSVPPEIKPLPRTPTLETLVQEVHFTTLRLTLPQPTSNFPLPQLTRPLFLICIEGQVHIHTHGAKPLTLLPHQLTLIPHALAHVSLTCPSPTILIATHP